MIDYAIFKKLFRILMEDGPRATYVAVLLDVDSRAMISDLMMVLGIPEDKRVGLHDLHATVTYSRAPIEDPTKIVQSYLPIMARGDELTIFHSRNSGKDCLVLKLSSVKLLALHQEIAKTGASHDFPTFEAHVTLSYDCPTDVKARALKMKDPKIELQFDDYEVSPLNMDGEA